MAQQQEKQSKARPGAPRGNRNAAKVGEDLRVEVYLSKVRRGFLEEWYVMKYGKQPNEEDLREAVRLISSNALTQALIEEFERHQPGRTSSGGEVF